MRKVECFCVVGYMVEREQRWGRVKWLRTGFPLFRFVPMSWWYLLTLISFAIYYFWVLLNIRVWFSALLFWTDYGGCWGTKSDTTHRISLSFSTLRETAISIWTHSCSFFFGKVIYWDRRPKKDVYACSESSSSNLSAKLKRCASKPNKKKNKITV